MKRVVAVGLALMLGISGGALAQTMARSEWAAKMREVMPGAFCKEGGYFRACFSQSAEACRAGAADAMDACLRRYDAQMPETFRAPEEGGRWGQVVGACAGTRFETIRRGVKVGSAKCRDPKAWP